MMLVSIRNSRTLRPLQITLIPHRQSVASIEHP